MSDTPEGESSDTPSEQYVKKSDLEATIRSILAEGHVEPDDEEEPEEDPLPSFTLSDIERLMEEKVVKAIKELTTKREARPKPPPTPPAATKKEPETEPVSPTRVNLRERIWGRP